MLGLNEYRTVVMLQIKMASDTGDENASEEMPRSELTKRCEIPGLGGTIPRLGTVRGRIH